MQVYLIGMVCPRPSAADGDEIVWKPVRCVAAVALRELVDHQFSRDMLKKHLAVLVDRLAAAAEEGGESTRSSHESANESHTAWLSLAHHL